MRNIRAHSINIPSDVIKSNWRIYSEKYRMVENGLNNSSTKSPSQNFSIHDTGSFQIFNSEIKALPHDDLSTYFIFQQDQKLVIKLKTKTLLRGIDYHVGIQNISNEDKTKIIFTRLFELIGLFSTVTLESNIVLYLALLDYTRNFLMIILYAIHQFYREFGEIESVNTEYKIFLILIRNIERSYIKTLAVGKIDLVKETSSYIPALNVINKYLIQFIRKTTYNKELSEDLFRKFRESDNPAKILHFSQVLAQEYLPQDTLIIGLEYGGIELPFIVNAARSVINKSELSTATVNISSYSTRSTAYVDSLEDILPPFTISSDIEKHTHILILDDSIMTGRTIEHLIKLLPSTVKEVYLACVSFTNSNRYHHLIRTNHGGINPDILSNMIIGYKSDYTTTYSTKTYKNKNGVFDKQKNRLKKLLQKDYTDLIN